MTLQERYNHILAWFVKEMPVAESELVYRNPYELIVAVILSAQCTDKRVNMITPDLFKDYPDIRSLSEENHEVILNYIKSVTYPNSKSKYLVNMAKMVVSEFNGVIPEEPSLLEKLPGVGRKTANVIASVLYNKPVIAVDTHVFRTSRRLGLAKGKTPLLVEKELTSNIPLELRAIAHHWLILHGRYICVARNPKCHRCGLTPYCLYYHKSCRANLHKGSTG